MLRPSQREGLVSNADFPDMDSIVYAYRKAVAKGMMKVMGKMGISTPVLQRCKFLKPLGLMARSSNDVLRNDEPRRRRRF